MRGSDHHDARSRKADAVTNARRDFASSSSWCAWCRLPNRWRGMRWSWCAPRGPTDATAPDFVKKYVNFGASVRAAQFLVLAGQGASADATAAIT